MLLRAYLAGPEVFLRDAAAVGEAKKAICARLGIDGVFPLDGAGALDGDPAVQADAIFRRCLAHIDACDVVIANMTPFRGASMDAGTAVEIGYAFARGMRVFAYTNAPADYRFRVEDVGFVDNLMCEGIVRASGGSVVRGDGPVDDLTAFEACVRLIPGA